MANNDNGHGDASVALPWYDYQPGVRSPYRVTHLRIGVQQAVAAAQIGSAPEIIELPEDVCDGKVKSCRKWNLWPAQG